MTQIEYTLSDHVAVMTLKRGENRFNPDFSVNGENNALCKNLK